MARIVLGSYYFRYPLGGMMSYVLQYLAGMSRLGHDVWFVEKATYENACFDPRRQVMTNDCSEGLRLGAELLDRFGLARQWCFVDFHGAYHGADRQAIESLFASADVFIDMGTHGAWSTESESAALRVYLDGEPGFRQMHWENDARAGRQPPEYDRYFTNGLNVGTPASPAPTAGLHWEHLPHPVVTAHYEPAPEPGPGAPFTTVMNWQSHPPLQFDGRTYGQKDIEFAHYLDLPRRASTPIEVAVAGKAVPRAELEAAGWQVRDAHDATASYDTFLDYARMSLGEFSVCKNVFVAMNTGWFSDKSAVFLALGRPVVVQDTGWSAHFPTGDGLFPVTSSEEAATAIDAIAGDWHRHSAAARSIAEDYFDSDVILAKFLSALGV